MLRIKLRYLDEANAYRKRVAQYYIKNIVNENLVLPKVEDWDANVFHLFPVRCKQRDVLQQYLSNNGVQTVIHYPIPPHKQECYKEWSNLSFPITERIHSEELSLPISPVMSEEEVVNIVSLLNNF